MPVNAASVGAKAAVAADPFARAHAQMLHDKALQFAFVSRTPPEPPSWLKAIAEFFKAIAPVLGWAFWIGLGLMLLAILFFIGRELIRVRWPEKKKPKGERTTPADWRPEPARARALLEDADKLAAEGRYAEAAHLLLYRSIEDIDERRPRAVRPALTARDISSLEGLPAAARTAFKVIAEVVERSFFGGREVGAPDFVACRQAYEAFAFPEAWA